jgi:NNP family nitrate/nitrite transporter-like MFS transporter
MFLVLGYSSPLSWRLSLVVVGSLLIAVGILYALFTVDNPRPPYLSVPAIPALCLPVAPAKEILQTDTDEPEPRQSACQALRGVAVAFLSWKAMLLFCAYAACFGVELTINSIASTYFFDRFELDIGTAGLVASSFGLMNLFARPLGGVFSDLLQRRFQLRGRVLWLSLTLLCQGLGCVWFAFMRQLAAAIIALIVFSLFLQMAEGATFAIVPLLNRRRIGVMSGIVGAGGNVGGILTALLFRVATDLWWQSLMIMGLVAAGLGVLQLLLLIRIDHWADLPPSSEADAPITSDRQVPASHDSSLGVELGSVHYDAVRTTDV